MEYDFHTSQLWLSTLGSTDPGKQKYINDLCTSFENIRDRIKELLAEIPHKFPGYTAHNISHSDALWRMTDIILTKSEITLNPVEAYVLGSSFLFHDLGMSPAIYGDYSSLRECDLWNDTYAYFVKEKEQEESAQKKADEETIRKLHAQNAEKLPLHCFKGQKGFEKDYTYLIENANLRNSLGETIGKIAASHGTPIDEIENILSMEEFSLTGYPTSWKINPIKLACILRIADAIHITADRVPYILWFTRKMDDMSRLHWNFHSKLHDPSVKDGRLIYQSKTAFTKLEQDSWWLCHDTLKMINQELLDVDSLLSRLKIKSLGAWCVKDIDSPKALSKQINVEGWTPVDIQMKVTNVSRLVQTLGGEALYGKNDLAPLRELVQNASDAIRARRKLDNEEESWGNVNITIDSDSEGLFLEVEDNGIGMSEKVLVGPFLDFGKSFWHSSLMRVELPGLENSDFQSTGHFGIGFYAVFMLGNKVSVTTRRYDENRNNTRVLEFNNGTNSRPLLRIAEKQECLKEGGTKIRVYLKNRSQWAEILADKEKTFESYIANLFPCMDCNINLKINKEPLKIIIKANDWMTMDPFLFIKRLQTKEKMHFYYPEKNEIDDEYIKKLSSRVCLVKDKNGTILGRGALDANIGGLLTTGGIRTGQTCLFAGVLLAECNVANRYNSNPCISEDELKPWIEEQVKILSKDLSWEKENSSFDIATLVNGFNVYTGKLSVAYYNGKAVNYEEIKQIIKNHDYDKYVVFQDATIHLCKEKDILYNKNVFWCSCGFHHISSEFHFGILGKNYLCNAYPQNAHDITDIVAKACAEVWQEDVNLIAKHSSDELKIEETIGISNGKEIRDNCVLVITKPAKNIDN